MILFGAFEVQDLGSRWQVGFKVYFGHLLFSLLKQQITRVTIRVTCYFIVCVNLRCLWLQSRFWLSADLFIWRSTNVDFHLFRLLLKTKCRFTKKNPWFSKSTQHFCILRVISSYAWTLTFCPKIVSKASIVTLFDQEIFNACNLSQYVQFVIVL